MISPADINYIHYPLANYYRDMNCKIPYYCVYDFIVKMIFKSIERMTSFGKKILTNSFWTANQIYKVHGIIADVVYPPVDVEYFSRVARNEKRERIVITMSRFIEEKRLERIVDVAAKLQNYTFVIAGLTDERSYIIIDKIEKKIREYRLNNVIIEPNLPKRKLLSYLGDARYYLHPEFPEHFGIAVVEAMAAGLVPLVYRDGGAWYDVVSKVSSLLGYSSIEEVPRIIQYIDSNINLYERLRRKSYMISKKFNYENFKLKLLRKVRYVLKVKGLIH